MHRFSRHNSDNSKKTDYRHDSSPELPDDYGLIETLSTVVMQTPLHSHSRDVSQNLTRATPHINFQTTPLSNVSTARQTTHRRTKNRKSKKKSSSKSHDHSIPDYDDKKKKEHRRFFSKAFSSYQIISTICITMLVFGVLFGLLGVNITIKHGFIRKFFRRSTHLSTFDASGTSHEIDDYLQSRRDVASASATDRESILESIKSQDEDDENADGTNSIFAGSPLIVESSKEEDDSISSGSDEEKDQKPIEAEPEPKPAPAPKPEKKVVKSPPTPPPPPPMTKHIWTYYAGYDCSNENAVSQLPPLLKACLSSMYHFHSDNNFKIHILNNRTITKYIAKADVELLIAKSDDWNALSTDMRVEIAMAAILSHHGGIYISPFTFFFESLEPYFKMLTGELIITEDIYPTIFDDSEDSSEANQESETEESSGIDENVDDEKSDGGDTSELIELDGDDDRSSRKQKKKKKKSKSGKSLPKALWSRKLLSPSLEYKESNGEGSVRHLSGMGSTTAFLGRKGKKSKKSRAQANAALKATTEDDDLNLMNGASAENEDDSVYKLFAKSQSEHDDQDQEQKESEQDQDQDTKHDSDDAGWESDALSAQLFGTVAKKAKKDGLPSELQPKSADEQASKPDEPIIKKTPIQLPVPSVIGLHSSRNDLSFQPWFLAVNPSDKASRMISRDYFENLVKSLPTLAKSKASSSTTLSNMQLRILDKLRQSIYDRHKAIDIDSVSNSGSDSVAAVDKMRMLISSCCVEHGDFRKFDWVTPNMEWLCNKWSKAYTATMRKQSKIIIDDSTVSRYEWSSFCFGGNDETFVYFDNNGGYYLGDPSITNAVDLLSRSVFTSVLTLADTDDDDDDNNRTPMKETVSKWIDDFKCID